MIVLDTHAWIWWTADAPELSASARERIDSTDEVHVSAISCWEVAMLIEKGRLNLGRDALSWVRLALRRPTMRLAPLAPEIAVRAAQIDGTLHGDPADRIIIATARHLRVPLVTVDRHIRTSGLVETVW